ncbi:phosphotransacetylase [Rhodohalobacter halophilus]|uniref:phosphotransacetylase n=1 Tax=Rhodohalobacter halophilus TaxID=1812810 RepID=UPI00083FC43F|nr:phosphotransacetylase [Rhodohalobacter halophilus]
MSLIEEIRQKASNLNKRVVLPEAERDIRVLKAAAMLSGMGLAKPILLGEKEKIENLAKEQGVELPDSVEIKPYRNSVFDEKKFRYFEKKLAHKNPTKEQIQEISLNPLFTAGWMLDTGKADAAVAGSVASTGEVIVSALRTVGVAEGSELVSSTFLMEMPDGKVFTYADCAVVPYPESDQLASIALDAGDTHRLLTGAEPLIAFLSFSTKGSAKHERVELVQQAYQKAKAAKPNWKMDGELQFDTAFVDSVAKRKAPDSEVGGNANVFIFPNLDAGNIAYKITERLAGATATGPILQGLSKPYMDLSRGCSVDDIVNTACVASLISQKSS